MIAHCDICGKMFDTDCEIGEEKDGLTFCEECAFLNSEEE